MGAYHELFMSPPKQQPDSNTQPPSAATEEPAGVRSDLPPAPDVQQLLAAQAPPPQLPVRQSHRSAAGPPHVTGLTEAQPPLLPQSERQAAASQSGDKQHALSGHQGCPTCDQASKCGSPKAAHPQHGGSSSRQRRRSQRAKRDSSCVPHLALYLPLGLLPLLLLLWRCPGPESVPGLLGGSAAAASGWRLACSWGGTTLLLTAQAAYAKAGWRLGTALDALYLLLSAGESVCNCFGCPARLPGCLLPLCPCAGVHAQVQALCDGVLHAGMPIAVPLHWNRSVLPLFRDAGFPPLAPLHPCSLLPRHSQRPTCGGGTAGLPPAHSSCRLQLHFSGQGAAAGRLWKPSTPEQAAAGPAWEAVKLPLTWLRCCACGGRPPTCT